MLSRVQQSVPDHVCFTSFRQCPDRAENGTLPAVDAGAFSHSRIPGGSDEYFMTPSDFRKCIDGLYIRTHFHASSACYTFVRIPLDGDTCLVNGQFFQFFRYRSRRYAHPVAKILQFAFPVCQTRRAIRIVISEYHLENKFSRISQPLIVGCYHHPVRNLCRTGPFGIFTAFNFDNADSAASRRFKILMITQRRNVNSVFLCGLYDSVVRTRLDRLTVDLN